MVNMNMRATISPLVSSVTTYVISLLLFYWICRALYRIFFHPLSKYPGPWYLAASRLPYTVWIFQGTVTHRVQKLHEQYGDAVRITPDSLSYISSQAWSDIYGLKQTHKQGNLSKDPKFYIKPPEGVETISTANDEDHRRMRRLQAHAFSEKALLLQEHYLKQYVEQFVLSLARTSAQNDGVVDIMKWLNFLTTDIIGCLSFGEDFGGLQTGKLHPWLNTVFITIKTFTFMRELTRYPAFIMNTILSLVPKSMMEHRRQALSFGAKAARRRMDLKTDRADFMSYILRHNDERGMSMSEIEAAAITFIVAGSETTATMLSGTLFLLLDNPKILAELTTSVRNEFKNRSEIVNLNLQKHEYLNAVLKEGLRLYPPAPDTLFRSTVNSTAIVAGRVVPPDTSLTMNLWAAGRSEQNYHRAQEFLPERWLKDAPGEFDKDDKGAFKPFSVGPRDCIGKNLAWAEMRIILAEILWNFDLLRVEPNSKNWIGKQKIFFLWEKPLLNIKIASRKW
ncbi:hypothetical protein AAE478_009947 [Parahypoxylon ruwenzoriense]